MMTNRLSPGIKLLNVGIFLLAILLKGFIDAFTASDPNSPLNMLKYLVLIACILCYAFEIAENRNRMQGFVFRDELQAFVVMMGIVIFSSIYFSTIHGQITSRSIKEFMFMTLPIFLVYCVLNVFTLSQIITCVKLSFVVISISYVLKVGVGFFSLSTISNALTSFSLAGGNTTSSNSVFESSAFADCLMAMFCFFAYYRRDNRIWLWISYLFVILANKRLMVVFATLIMILIYIPGFKKIENFRFNKWILFLMGVMFTALPYGVIILSQPQAEFHIFQKFGINLADFWMGRDGMITNILSSNYKSFGLGSTSLFLGYTLEVESVKFLLEIGPIGLLAISISYWWSTNGILFTMIVMFYNFINMATSTSIMTGTFPWIFYLLLVGCASQYGNTADSPKSSISFIERR